VLSVTCRLKAILQLLAVVYPGDTEINFVESQYGGRTHVVSYDVIIFVPKMGTLPYLMVFLHSTSCSSFWDIRGSKVYIRGPCAPWTPLGRGESFVPEASTLSHL